MKHKNKNMNAMAIMALSSALLLGCEKIPDEEQQKHCNLVVAVQNTANMNKVSLNTESINDALLNTSYTSGKCAFISIDGSPEVVFDTVIPEIESNLSDNKKAELAENYTNQLKTALDQIKANDEEVDILEAFRLSGLSVKNRDGDNLILMISNGGATKGYLNFAAQPELFDMDPAEVVKMLKEKDAIPDVSNCRIKFVYCGEMALPQEKLSESQKRKMKEIYKAVLLEGGAKDVEFADDIPSADPNVDCPYVSLINADIREIKPISTIVLDETSLKFVGDTADFVNPDAALQAINMVADALNNNLENNVYIIGTTASGDEAFCKDLSLKRANAVKDILVNVYGIDPSRLKVMGLGYNDPWHQNDIDVYGNHIASIASQNRTVRIIDERSEDMERVG